MFSAETLAMIPEWNVRKRAQWDRVAGTMPGLQLIRHGQASSSFMLVCSTDDFYEGVLYGQLPQVQTVETGPRHNRVRSDVPDAKKRPDRRLVDLDDAQIDAVLACWARGDSAAAVLPAGASFWNRDGQERRAG